MNPRRTAPRRVVAPIVAVLVVAAATLGCATSASAGTGFVAATDLAPIVGGAPYGPNVASAADGTGFTAWVEPGTPAQALVAVRPPGGSWSTQDLGDTVQTPGGLSIATAADGTATALVIDADGKTLRAFTRSAGGTFGSPRPLTAGDNAVLGTSLAMNASGDAIAAWRESPDGGSTWQTKADYRDGGGWNPSVPLGPAAPMALAGQESPLAAINAAGRSAVTYTTYDGSNFHVTASIRPAGGNFPSTPTGIDTTAVSTYHPTIAMSTAGAVVIGYLRAPGGNPIVQWRYAVPGATAFEPAQQLSAGGDLGTQVTVAAGPGDLFSAAWVQQPSGRVQYGTGTVTGGFSSATRRYLSPDGNPADTPVLAVDPAGNSFVSWANGTTSTVQAAYRPAGSADFGGTQTVTASGSGGQSDLSVSLDAQGNVLVAWTRYLAPSPGQFVQVAGYDVGAPSLSGVAVPSTSLSGAPATFSATATDVWSTPTITWSFGDGASAAGGSVTHAYGGPGSFTATATATDAFGNTTSASSPVAVALPPTQPPVVAPPGGGGVAAPHFGTLATTATLMWGRLRKGAPTPIVSLRVSGVKVGDTVALACKGKGCAKRATVKPTTLTAKKIKKGRYALTGAVGGLHLSSGATLTVTVARAGYVSRIVSYAMRSGKAPLKATTCQAPNVRTATTCA